MPPDQRSRDTRRTPFSVILSCLFAIVSTIAIVVFLSTARIISPAKVARRAATEAILSDVASMVRTYNLETGDYPPTLDALVPKYREKPPLDAWKRPFVYTLSPGRPPFTLGSLGADGQTGGSGDDADIWAQLP